MEQGSNRTRWFAALRALDSTERLSQRSLADDLDISLGSVNALLRELAATGLIAMSAAATDRRGLDYRLTAAGRRKLRSLTDEMAAQAALLLAGPREQLEEAAADWRQAGRKRVLLCGCGPAADVAASALLNAGLKLAGVVSREEDPGRVAGLRVRPLGDAGEIRCDAAVCLRSGDMRPLRRRLPRATPVMSFPPADGGGKRRG